MIDWLFVARNALWILGLSVVLATVSYASWWASGRGTSLRQALARPAFTTAWAAGLVCFCLGLAWSADRLWERGLWLVLALAFAWQTIAAYRMNRARGTHTEEPD